jgi:hypothetical protein
VYFFPDVPVKPSLGRKCKRVKTSQSEDLHISKQSPNLVKDEGDNFMSLFLRSSPSSFARVMTELNKAQQQVLHDFGFGSLVGFNIRSLPGKLAYYVVDAFDPENMVIRTSKGDIPCDRDAVRDVFGLPNGPNDILGFPSKENSDFVNEWLRQFPKDTSVRKKLVVDAILKTGNTDNLFKMNILMLFANTMVISSTNGEFSKEVLHHVPIDADMSTLDWCGYLLKYLKVSKKNWDRNHPEKNLYAGPATFLAVSFSF